MRSPGFRTRSAPRAPRLGPAGTVLDGLVHLYFEIDNSDSLRATWFAADGRAFEGNKAETTTIVLSIEGSV